MPLSIGPRYFYFSLYVWNNVDDFYRTDTLFEFVYFSRVIRTYSTLSLPVIMCAHSTASG